MLLQPRMSCHPYFVASHETERLCDFATQQFCVNITVNISTSKYDQVKTTTRLAFVWRCGTVSLAPSSTRAVSQPKREHRRGNHSLPESRQTHYRSISAMQGDYIFPTRRLESLRG